MNSRSRRLIYYNHHHQNQFNHLIHSMESMTQNDEESSNYNEQSHQKINQNNLKSIQSQQLILKQQQSTQNSQLQQSFQPDLSNSYYLQSQSNISAFSSSLFSPSQYLNLSEILLHLQKIILRQKTSFYKNQIKQLINKIRSLNCPAASKLELKDLLMIDRILLDMNIFIQRQECFKMKIWVGGQKKYK